MKWDETPPQNRTLADMGCFSSCGCNITRAEVATQQARLKAEFYERHARRVGA